MNSHMVALGEGSPDHDDPRSASTVQPVTPLSVVSSFPPHGSALGARAAGGDQDLDEMLDDFDIPAVAGGTVDALTSAIHLLCRSTFGRVSVSHGEMACSPVPGRTHSRDTTQLDGHASLRSVLGLSSTVTPHCGPCWDTAQRDSHASLQTVLQSPNPGRIQDRGQRDSHASLQTVLQSPDLGRIQDRGSGTCAQAAACTVQSHGRRIIARRRFVHLIMARERAVYARRLARVACAQAAACTVQSREHSLAVGSPADPPDPRELCLGTDSSVGDGGEATCKASGDSAHELAAAIAIQAQVRRVGARG